MKVRPSIYFRLAAQIVSGLGFLGAGVILKDGLRVKGLTPAAMIFYVVGVGIGIGAGFYGIVIFATLVTFIMTRIGNIFEGREITTVRLPKIGKKKRMRKKRGWMWCRASKRSGFWCSLYNWIKTDL